LLPRRIFGKLADFARISEKLSMFGKLRAKYLFGATHARQSKTVRVLQKTHIAILGARMPLETQKNRRML
jgi:hypothetical protein